MKKKNKKKAAVRRKRPVVKRSTTKKVPLRAKKRSVKRRPRSVRSTTPKGPVGLMHVSQGSLVADRPPEAFPDRLRARVDPQEPHMVIVAVGGAEHRLFGGQRLTFPAAHGTTGVGQVAYDQIDTEGSIRVKHVFTFAAKPGRKSRALTTTRVEYRDHPAFRIYERFDPRAKVVHGKDGQTYRIG